MQLLLWFLLRLSSCAMLCPARCCCGLLQAGRSFSHTSVRVGGMNETCLPIPNTSCRQRMQVWASTQPRSHTNYNREVHCSTGRRHTALRSSTQTPTATAWQEPSCVLDSRGCLQGLQLLACQRSRQSSSRKSKRANMLPLSRAASFSARTACLISGSVTAVRPGGTSLSGST